MATNETAPEQAGPAGPAGGDGGGGDDAGGPQVAPVWRAATLIGTGLFVTGLGWPGLIGRLPFGLLLKNGLHLPPEKVAAFWAVATVAWYLKPLVGLICDSIPILGTRRRGYLLGGSVAAMVAWAGFSFVPRTYLPFLALMTGLNIALVFITTTIGGLMVEEGQRLSATGRLSALLTGMEGLTSLAAGPLGGVLAATAFVWTSVTGAAVMAMMFPVTLILCPEPRRAVRNTAVWAATAVQLRRIVRSRPMWMTSILIFLVYLAPGLQTPLLYYQQDVLKFDVRFMGILQFGGGVGLIAGSAVYAWACRRMPLRLTLIGGILVNAASPFLYMGYRSATAALIIDTAAGFSGALGTLPVYDLAVRSTPAGSESFGYALMMSVRNISLFVFSDVLGSMLYGRFHVAFDKLLWINSASSAAVLLFVPLVPAALLAKHEEKT